MPVTLHRYDGLIHGFLRMPGVITRADQVLSLVAGAVADALAPGPAWSLNDTSGPGGVSVAAMPRAAKRLDGLGTTVFTEMTALAQRTGAINLGQGFPDRTGRRR